MWLESLGNVKIQCHMTETETMIIHLTTVQLFQPFASVPYVYVHFAWEKCHNFNQFVPVNKQWSMMTYIERKKYPEGEGWGGGGG